MSQPALAASAPAPFLRRAFDWWIAQVKHALPPTIFFFVGFNLILWTKRLILAEHGTDYTGFLAATVAALLVGKARHIDLHNEIVTAAGRLSGGQFPHSK